MTFFLYILRCSDNSLYIGYTHSLPERIAAHNAGQAAAWTRRHRPVTLIYSEEFATELQAMRREQQLKGWSRKKKEALIAGNKPGLKRLSMCRSLHPLPTE